MEKKILIVDDSVFIRKVTANVLKSAGYNDIVEADTGRKALDLFKSEKPGVVVLDVTLPDCDDLCVCKEMLRLNKDVKIIIYTAVSQELVKKEAMEAGVYKYFNKPMDNEEFLDAVKNAFE